MPEETSPQSNQVDEDCPQLPLAGSLGGFLVGIPVAGWAVLAALGTAGLGYWIYSLFAETHELGPSYYAAIEEARASRVAYEAYMNSLAQAAYNAALQNQLNQLSQATWEERYWATHPPQHLAWDRNTEALLTASETEAIARFIPEGTKLAKDLFDAGFPEGIVIDRLRLAAEMAKVPSFAIDRLANQIIAQVEAVLAGNALQARRAQVQTISEVEAIDIDAAGTMAGTPSIPWIGALSSAGLLAGAGVLARNFAKAAHDQQLSCMQTTGQALLQSVLKMALPAAVATAWMLSPDLQAGLTGLAGKAIDFVYSPLEKMAPMTPEKAPGAGIQLLLQAVLMGSGAHLMAVAAESSATLKTMGLGYLSAFMVDMAGFSRIAAAFQGQMINWGLMQPMRYWSLEKFRPMIPREDELIRLVGEKAITREEFNQAMPYHGFSQEWIDRLYELADRPLSPMLFRYLGEAGLLDDELINRELMNACYNPRTIPYLKQWLQKVAAGELKGVFGSVPAKGYRLGLLMDEEFRSHEDNLGFSAPQAEKALYATRLDFAIELAEDTKKLYLDQFNKGYIEDYDLQLRLSGLGYRPEVVSVEVARAVLKRKPKPEAKVDPQVEKEMRQLQAKYITLYTELYRQDQIDEEQFYSYLVKLGIGSELATVTVNIESVKKLPRVAA